MNAARALRYARRRAGLSQRELAQRSGVPQSTVGRIESGAVDPRISTLDRLLRTCEFDLEVEPLLGIGVDRSQIREMLGLSPSERLARSVQGAQFVALLRQAHCTGVAASGKV
jgi:predicted transcriptional regulator